MLKIREIKARIGFKGELTTQNILDDLDFAVKNGFNCLEISVRSERDFNLTPRIIKQIRNISEENNISLFVHPSPFLPIAIPFPEISGAVRKVIKKSIIFASKINANHLILHSGHKEISGPAIAKNYETLIKNLKEIVKVGKKYEIKIALENSNKYSNAVCIKPDELLKVVNSVEGLKILFDVGHANTTGINHIKYFKQIRDFVINIHLHDNDGRTDQHALIGEGNINFKNLLKDCKKQIIMDHLY